MSTYEAKVSGLEHEIETQREQYEKKLEDLAQRYFTWKIIPILNTEIAIMLKF